MLDPCFEGREQIVCGVGTRGQEAVAEIVWADLRQSNAPCRAPETGDKSLLFPYFCFWHPESDGGRYARFRNS